MERHKQAVMGPHDKVPCPWCSQENDFRDLDGMIDSGNTYDCDHCQRKMEVVRIDARPRIVVRQYHKGQ